MPSLGLTYALTAAASYGLMSFLVHWNPGQHPVSQLIFLRSLASLLILFPFCWRRIDSYFKKNSLSLWVRSIAGTGGVFCYYYALQGTASANANLLFSSSPIFVGALAWLLFRERISRIEGIGIAAIVFGNFLLYLPNRGEMPSWVWAVGLTGALFASFAYLSLGAAAKKYPSSLIVVGFAVVSGGVALLWPDQAWGPVNSSTLPFLVIVSLLGLVSQLTATLSFAYLKSSVATSIARTSILFSGVLDILIAHYRPHVLEWVSYLVVLIGIFLANQKPRPTPVPSTSAI